MVNACIRCGKERVVIKTTQEKIKNDLRVNFITHIKTSCPDKSCQKEVDKMLALQRQKDDERKTERMNREKVEKEERAKKAEINMLKAKKKKRK